MLRLKKTDETETENVRNWAYLCDLFKHSVYLSPSNILNEFLFYNQTITVTTLPGTSVNVTAVYSMWFWSEDTLKTAATASFR